MFFFSGEISLPYQQLLFICIHPKFDFPKDAKYVGVLTLPQNFSIKATLLVFISVGLSVCLSAMLWCYPIFIINSSTYENKFKETGLGSRVSLFLEFFFKQSKGFKFEA